MKIKSLPNIFLFLITFGLLTACSSKKDNKDTPIKSFKNEKFVGGINGKKHDVDLLVRQKMQEVFELSSLRWQTKDDDDLDSLLLVQLASYFDSSSLAYQDIEAAMDSSNVFSTRIVDLNLKEDSTLAESLQKMVLTVDYMGAKDRQIGRQTQEVSFYLKAAAEKKDSLFSFFFVDWKDITATDSTAIE